VNANTHSYDDLSQIVKSCRPGERSAYEMALGAGLRPRRHPRPKVSSAPMANCQRKSVRAERETCGQQQCGVRDPRTARRRVSLWIRRKILLFF